jgi:hypothetical protein
MNAHTSFWTQASCDTVNQDNDSHVEGIKRIKYMKIKQIFIPVICLILGISACSPKVDTTLNEATMSAIYTSVVQTLALTQQVVIPTITLLPTQAATDTPMPSATLGIDYPTPTRYVAPVTLCDDSIFLGDITIPDNTVMTPGQIFTKTWSIENSGTCGWTTSYKLVYLRGDLMSGVSTNLVEAVNSGHSDNISIKLVAPNVKGTYTGYWILQNPAGKNFGQFVNVTIIVSTSITPTPTGTITPTPNLTATYNALSTAYSAATSFAAIVNAAAATATPTPTPSPTPIETPVTPSAT